MTTNNIPSHVPNRRVAGSPAARAYGATDPDRRGAAIKAVKLRYVATEAVTKAQRQGKKVADLIAVYDQKHVLMGFVSESDIKPMATGPDAVKKSNLGAYLRAASAAKRSQARQPDAVQLLKALAALHLRNRVRKSGEKLGGFDLIATGAAVRSKLPAADRQRFDKLLAKSSMDSRRRLDRRLQQSKARLGLG